MSPTPGLAQTGAFGASPLIPMSVRPLVWPPASACPGACRLVSNVPQAPGERAVPPCRPLAPAHLHLQLADVVHGPGLVIVVIVGHSAEAACPLLVGDTALGQVLHGPGAPDAVLGDPGRDAGGVEVFTFQDFHVDQVGSLGREAAE